MAVKELNAKEQHYADTREEAENIVEEAKDDAYLTSFKISEKHNKYGQYFLVDLAFSYDTPREIMENAKPKNEEPAEEPREGIEYSIEGDGTVSVNQKEGEDE
jgi:hypothetical protein